MSYSIAAKGLTVAAAMAALSAKFDEQVVKHQPMHAGDRDVALASASNVANLLGDVPAEHVVVITLNGSLGWRGADTTTDLAITAATANATAYVAPASTEGLPAD